MATKLSKPDFPLNARTGPKLVLMTDERPADWARAARALPRGSLVIVRAREDKERETLARQLQAFAPLLIAGDPALAARLGAAGLHLPQARMKEALHWRVRNPGWIITAAAHSLNALMAARCLDAVLLSPVLATGSHGDAKPLTAVRAGRIAALAPVPVYALGGVGPHNWARLPPVFAGIAAISSLLGAFQIDVQEDRIEL